MTPDAVAFAAKLTKKLEAASKTGTAAHLNAKEAELVLMVMRQWADARIRAVKARLTKSKVTP